MFKFFYDVYSDLTLALVIFVYIGFHWQSDIAHFAGVAIAICAMILQMKARVDLGSAYSVLPVPKQLVTNGIYGYIRHPIYLFSSLVVIGFCIALEYPLLYAFAMLFVCIQIIRARMEERAFAATMPAAYEAYRQRTWF